jgi:hypothetical protein
MRLCAVVKTKIDETKKKRLTVAKLAISLETGRMTMCAKIWQN